MNDSPIYSKEIVYDRETKDFAMFLDGELIGFARTMHDAEVTLDQLVYDLLSRACRTVRVAAGCPTCGTDDEELTDEYEVQYENIPYPHGIGNPDTPADDEAH